MTPYGRLLCTVLILLSLLSTTALARSVTDMAGRTVEIPEHPSRLFPAITALTPVLAALAPEQMVALSFALPSGAADFLPPEISSLPVVSVLQNPDPERLLAIQADLVLSWTGPGGQQEKTLALMARLHKPVVLLDGERLAQYPATFRTLGRILERPERGDYLANALTQRQADLKARLQNIPDKQRPRVYYAESPDGLVSQCHDSSRLEVIELAGGIPALTCHTTGFANAQTLSFEQLLLINPDVILTRDARIKQQLQADPRWQRVTAVKNGQLYAIPEAPFNWFDRPPSFMRMLGAHWLATLLYPERVPKGELRPYVVRFMQDFFHVTPPEAALDRLLLQ